MSALIAVVSLSAFFYLPYRLRTAATTSLVDATHSLAAITAHSLSDALAAGTPVQVAPILNALQRHEEVVYVVVVDNSGTPIASFNEQLADRAEYRTVAMKPTVSGPARPVPTRAGPGRADARARAQTEGGFSVREPIYQAAAQVLDRGRRVGKVYLGISTRAIDEETARGRRTAAFLGFSILGLGVLGATALSTVLSRPIRRIAATTERIAAGARGERAHVAGEDEVGQLASSFNAMVDRLEEAQRSMEDLNRGLEERVVVRTRELSASEEKYRLLFERNLAGVYVADLEGMILTANPACARMFGYDDVEEFIRIGRITYVDPAQREVFLDLIRREGQVMNMEVQLQGRTGEPLWALENAQIVPGRAEFEAILLDITDRKRAELDIEYRAYHDPLTDLPNRNLLRDRLEVAVAHARRRERILAVLFLDVDDLKGINDTLGHATGDQVLQLVGERLRSAVRDEDTVARIGGDEFAVVLSDLESDEMVGKLADAVVAALQPPFLLENEEIRLTASIGIAVYPHDGEDPDTLLRNADSTMYRIKEKGGRGVRRFDEADMARGLRRSSLEKELREGLERGEFGPFYQPQFDLGTGELAGAEALVRWRHPEGIIVAPSHFISLAEYTGLVIPLGEQMLRQTVIDLRRWQLAGHRQIMVGVNVSARQFHQRDFVGMITSVIRDAGLDPGWLELEITESLAVQKSGWILRLLQRIRQLGIRIAVDDFGTGRSSLVYLKNFPVDTIKIDREFVSGIASNDSDRSIVNAIILLANNLGLRTVAEGVETEVEADILRTDGCREGQGFYWGEAVPAAEFEKMLVRASEATPRP
ncbi:MAG TPA: EAL domain-containing protein [Thermoanaerobaculia bacterium]|nr:EAL domain-containing protein [Thermoanaerobaculia bacterium]